MNDTFTVDRCGVHGDRCAEYGINLRGNFVADPAIVPLICLSARVNADSSCGDWQIIEFRQEDRPSVAAGWRTRSRWVSEWVSDE